MPQPNAAKRAARAKLNPALARNAAMEAEARLERVRKAARADIALILRRKARIVEDFYDIGEALARLHAPAVPEALGYASFEELCARELGFAATTALHLVAIAKGATREEALRFGQERTGLLIEIGAIVGEGVESVASAKLALPSGKKLDVAKATTRALRDAAKELRAAKHPGRARGRTTTPAERGVARALEAELRRAGAKEAIAVALATSPGQAAKLRVEVPIDALAVLAKASRTIATRARG